jgi:exodeoxyribonuclease III
MSTTAVPPPPAVAHSLTILSWNVNGLRACLRNNGAAFDRQLSGADCVALQETKMSAEHWPIVLREIDSRLPGWTVHYVDASNRKGYAGTALLCRTPPLRVETPRLGVGPDAEGRDADDEGRVIVAYFDNYAVVSVYTCNSGRGGGLSRLRYRTERWDAAFREYCAEVLETERARCDNFHLLVAGDLNVAHEDVDLARPAANRNVSPGCTDAEREAFAQLLSCCTLRDSFRQRHPTAQGAYSWWPYMGKARARNVGWRIDYVLSTLPADRFAEAFVLADVGGSDHCPVGLTLERA